MKRWISLLAVCILIPAGSFCEEADWSLETSETQAEQITMAQEAPETAVSAAETPAVPEETPFVPAEAPDAPAEVLRICAQSRISSKDAASDAMNLQ